VHRALVDLILLTVRGRLLRQARLLRQPRYLIALLAGLLYFAMVFRNSFGVRIGGPRGFVPGPYVDALHLGIALAAAVFLTVAWLLTSAKPALRLTETEIDFLLPAPLPRRQIILYSLLRQQPALLGSVLVIYFLRSSRLGGPVVPAFVGTWALLTLLDFHLKGISLWKARLKELPPAAAGWRLGMAVALGLAWWTALLTALRLDWRAASATEALDADPGAFLLALARAVESGVANVLLAPFRWATGPVSAGGSPWLSLAFLLLLTAVHAEWVMRSRVSFEEATLERARRESARKTVSRQELRARSPRHREPFHLAPSGPPEAAIAWKNLMLRSRYPLARTAALMALIPIALTALAATVGPPMTVFPVVFGIALLGIFPLFAGILQRNDLRNDLLHTDLLRTWPLRGSRLVFAELLAPAATTFLNMLLGCGMIAAGLIGEAANGDTPHLVRLLRPLAGDHPLPALPVFLLSLLISGTAMAFLSLAILNLAVLVVPSWVGLGLTLRRGTAVLGQRLVMSFGYLLTLVIALLPTLLVLGAVAALHIFQKIPFHLWELPLLALTAALLLGLEAAVLIRIAGAIWERMDPSEEMLAGGEE
jgi:hypothetical protein